MKHFTLAVGVFFDGSASTGYWFIDVPAFD